MDDRLAARLRTEEFVDDPRIRVAVSDYEAWLPEQLLERALRIGQGYRLHVLSTMASEPLHAGVILNHQQAQGLEEELRFIADLLDDRDAALVAALSQMLTVTSTSVRLRVPLTIEGP